MTAISERYRRLAEGFTARVEAVPADDPRWDRPSPCEGWDARAVVGHLVDAHATFFGLVGLPAPDAPPVADDPAAAWSAVRDATVAALEDPEVAAREYDGHFGRARWEESMDRFVSGDVLAHTWDLARALGLDDTLDPDEVRTAHEGMAALGDAIRQPGVFGPEVAPPPDATEQERFVAFLGRDPRWAAPA